MSQKWYQFCHTEDRDNFYFCARIIKFTTYGNVKNFTNAVTHLLIIVNAIDVVPINVYAIRVRNIIYLYKKKISCFQNLNFLISHRNHVTYDGALITLRNTNKGSTNSATCGGF